MKILQIKLKTGLASLLLAGMALFLAACSSTPTAVMDYDPGFDFSAVKTIAILPLNRSVSSIADISDIQAARVNGAFSSELMRRGFTVVEDANTADLLMTWHLVTQEQTDVRTYNTSSAHYRSCWNCPRGWGASTQNVSVRQFTQGTLIADMIDPASMQSVWRSIFEDRVRDLDAEEAAEKRETVAAALFAEFPPN
jgi:uncharacterized protein DUF4136